MTELVLQNVLHAIEAIECQKVTAPALARVYVGQNACGRVELGQSLPLFLSLCFLSRSARRSTTAFFHKNICTLANLNPRFCRTCRP